MGSEGQFAYELQRALESVFRAHEQAIEGLRRKNTVLIAELKKEKRNVETLDRQVRELYQSNLRLENEKARFEDLRRRGLLDG
jgi:Skp family chaperone for outer membrane proteins